MHRTPCFETPCFARLLGMRVCVSGHGPHPEERPLGRVSKDDGFLHDF